MRWARIAGATRALGAPADWDYDRDGPCGALPIREGVYAIDTPTMTSAWLPTPEELALLNAGMPVTLTVLGRMHPPVAVSVDVEHAEVME